MFLSPRIQTPFSPTKGTLPTSDIENEINSNFFMIVLYF